MSAAWTATKNARIIHNMIVGGASVEAIAAMRNEQQRQAEKWRQGQKASQDASCLRQDAPGTTDKGPVRSNRG